MARSLRDLMLGPAAALVLLASVDCTAPPPNVARVPASGLSLRVHVFGSSASDVNDAFIAANKKTPAFHVVRDGGDGDLVVGLENDSPMCVAPTGLCSFKVSYRVRNNDGEAVAAATTTITAQADHCAHLCTEAINNVVVKILEDAATAIGSRARPQGKSAPMICSIASGPRLPTDEAEARAAQVEVLKRIGVLEQNEYDCLRKAYLGRL